MRLWKCDICTKEMRDDSEVTMVTLSVIKEPDDCNATPYGVKFMSDCETHEICEECARNLKKVLKGEFRQ